MKIFIELFANIFYNKNYIQKKKNPLGFGDLSSLGF